jgi:hypothetical protein
MPGFRSYFWQLGVTTAALAALSYVQPLRLNFDGPGQLLLAGGVLSASWIFYVALTSVVVYSLLLQQQKKKTTAGKATV